MNDIMMDNTSHRGCRSARDQHRKEVAGACEVDKNPGDRVLGVIVVGEQDTVRTFDEFVAHSARSPSTFCLLAYYGHLRLLFHLSWYHASDQRPLDMLILTRPSSANGQNEGASPKLSLG